MLSSEARVCLCLTTGKTPSTEPKMETNECATSAQLQPDTPCVNSTCEQQSRKEGLSMKFGKDPAEGLSERPGTVYI